MIKLNIDAGFDPNTRHARLGFIARNHLGEVIFSGWSSDRLYYTAEEAKCLAALVGVRKTLLVFTRVLFGWNQALWLRYEL